MTDHILIPDTHVLLHGAFFQNAPWGTLIKGNPVLGISSTVLDEVDEWKYKGGNSKLNDRARKIGPALVKAIRAGKLDDGTPVVLLEDLPEDQMVKHGLNPGKADHQILGTAILAKMQGKEVSVVSNDSNMQLRGPPKGVDIIEVESWIAPAADERDAKLVKQEQDLRSLKNALPSMSLSVTGATKIPSEVVSLSPEPESADAAARAKADVADMQQQLVYNPMYRVGITDKGRIQKELRDFEPTLEAHYADRFAKQSELSAIFPLELTLANDGGAPAQDVDVFLKAPDGFEFIEPEAVPEEPARPESPLPKISGLAAFASMGAMPKDLIRVLGGRSLPEYTGPFVETGGKSVRLHLKHLKHKMEARLDEVHMKCLGPLPNVVEVPFHVLAGNHPTPEEGKVVLKLTRGTGTPRWREDE